MIIDVNAYSEELKSLWYTVFGDDIEYISLLFDKGYTPTECFGIVDNGRVVSALYLLSCGIKASDKMYKGRYLYAAATLEEYRGKGLMSKLIYEAEEYADAKGLDFISLVPATDKLYEYYSKFGFEPLMYNYTSYYDGKSVAGTDEKISLAEVINIRNSTCKDAFLFDEKEMKYAYMCLSYAGYEFYKNSDDSYYIADKERKEIIEYISSDKNLRSNTEKLFSALGSATVNSPYDLNEYCTSEKKRYGMIYSPKMNIIQAFSEGIYMNLALD